MMPVKKKSRACALDRRIGGNLVKLRTKMKLSQQKMAAILGVTFQQVQKYEKGSNRLSAANLYRLHQYFDVPLDYFFASHDGKHTGPSAGFVMPARELSDRQALDNDREHNNTIGHKQQRIADVT